VVNTSLQEVIAMKKLSVLILIAILGIVLWALPAGAEKIRLSDAQLDEITAGQLFPCGQVCVPLSKGGGVAGAGIDAWGAFLGSGLPLTGSFEAGGGTPLPQQLDTVAATIRAQGTTPMTGNFSIMFIVPGIPTRCIGFGPGACPP
jgi:hypothetical protein